MEHDLGVFLTANASALFALVGALGGGVLSFFSAMMLKRREFNLNISGKLLERRITSHENIISLAVELRVMVALGGESPSGDVRRAPQIMMSQVEFEDWLAHFAQLGLKGTSWLSNNTKKEVYFIQDYLVTLHMYLDGIPSDKYLELGELIRQDFIDLSSSLEKKAFSFFQTGIRKLKPDSLDEWHKYEISETQSRLASTNLVRNHEAFNKAKEDA
ncbi:hypothetical protein [Pantoea vagans]|uniref:hypothetical protein n=1 Tax=Pantoea vagans TaxID=470934 RepID=UPI003FA36493